LNVNGKKVPQKGYITDELTDYAVEWMRTLPKNQPYFLYLSHKAVHAEFQPAKRHEGMYKDAKFVYPPTMAADGEMAQNRPTWVKNQRNSWHGVDYPYHSTLDIADYFKRYAETLMAVDESIGRVFDALKARGELDSTLVIYMGDNGFAFGEHGLIDKRTAYEESMRVPLLARCPDLFGGGKTVKEVVAGIDIMPTVLATAGAAVPKGDELAAAGARAGGAVAEGVVVRVLLGAEFPADADDAFVARGAVQVHPVPGDLGYR